MQATSAGSHGLTKFTEPSPSPAHSSTPSALQNSVNHAEMTDDAGTSTPTVASVVSSRSQKSPLTTGQNRAGVTYAYRTARSPEQSPPIHLAESPETVNAAVPPTAKPSTSKQIASHGSVPPSRASSEPGFTSEGPPLAKNKSGRKRRREAKRLVAAAPTVLPATTTDALLDPTEPVIPNAIEDRDVCDPPQHDDGQTVSDLDVPSTPADIKPEPSTVAQAGDEQQRLGEDMTETDQDDSVLNMRAGLIVNGVSYSP